MIETYHRFIEGDCRQVLETLPAGSVHCVMTSPPYFGLRSYGGGECEIGAETEIESYVDALVDSFRAVRRVLRDDGTVWLNLGDSYTSGGRQGHGARVGPKQQTNRGMDGKNDPARPPIPAGLKPKDLIGIPWRVAMALQADGWYLRSDIIWDKVNPMPESVLDRPTRSHEYLFLISKSETYYYDTLAIAEQSRREPHAPKGGITGSANGVDFADRERVWGQGMTRNKRTVWKIPTESNKGAHFAVYPVLLCAPCILAGTSERGVCPRCGAQWIRMVETRRYPTRPGLDSKAKDEKGNKKSSMEIGNRDPQRHVTETRTLGWDAGCTCHAGAEIPATVLDPFSGTGTTARAARQLGRSSIGIELNPKYIKIAERLLRRGTARGKTPETLPGQLSFFGME